jgi:hypothetical protein
MRATAATASSEVPSDFPADAQSSDHLLLRALESEDAPPRTEQMVALRGDLRGAPKPKVKAATASSAASILIVFVAGQFGLDVPPAAAAATRDPRWRSPEATYGRRRPDV